jgi:Zn-dependent M28 family amino/carboxypeptidase
MFRKLINLSLVTTLAFAVAVAQRPTVSPPSVERIREHVTYLASDRLAGRRTGTPGASDAANYIAAEFKRLGLKPVPREVSLSRTRGAVGYYDSYLQPFPYVAGVELGKANGLSFSLGDNASRHQLLAGDDWMPLGLSSNGKINAPAVFVGYGITALELNYNDYAGTDAANKIALVLSGTPDGANPHGQFGRYEAVRWKAIAARNAGAKALIVIGREEIFKDDPLSRLRHDNAGDAGLPAAVISRQSAQRLFLGSTLKDLETAAGTKNIAAVNKTLINVSLSTDLVRFEAPAYNVIGILEGSDPVLKNETIVIGAHYDHLGLGGEGSLAPKEGEIHHGADDNASGTAGVIELARLFATQKPRPRRTIVFIAFSGEEEGLLGSNYYVNHPVVPLANTVAMINMDMIGRMKNKSLVIGGVGTASEWRPMIESASLLQSVTVTANGTKTAASASVGNVPLVVAANGATIVSSDSAKQFQLTLNEDGFGPSDHSSFYAKQIPVLFLWTGTHNDYHKPSDTADKINYDDEVRILSFAKQLINDIDRNDKRPQYTVAKTVSTGRSMGFRVYLGTIPNYADSNDGLLLDGVRDESPAAKAGLKAGDKIVKLAGREVRNVYDYTAALGEMKAGQEYEVEIMRGSERLALKITPTRR